MNIDAERQAFLNQMGSAAPLIALFDLMPDVSFFLKDRAGRFMALNLRGCENLHRHFAKPISTSELGKQSGLSIRPFERTFRKALGACFGHYNFHVRIEQSCHLLVD